MVSKKDMPQCIRDSHDDTLSAQVVTVENLGLDVVSTTANPNPAASYTMYLVDTSGGNVTITLPEVTSDNAGVSIIVKKVHASNTLTIDTTGADTIDGAASVALSDDDTALHFKSDGSSDWRIVGEYDSAVGPGGGNTLDQAYDQGGAGAGRSVVADTGAVAISSSANGVLDLDGDHDTAALIDVDHSTTGSAITIDIDKTSTDASGNCVDIDNNGTGQGLKVRQDGEGTAVYIDSNVTGSSGALVIEYSGTGQAIDIDLSDNGQGINVFRNVAGSTQGVVALRNVQGGGPVLFVEANTAATGNCLELESSGSGIGLFVDHNNASGQEALRIDNDSTNDAVEINGATGIGIDLNHNTTGSEITIDIDKSSTDASGNVIDINNAGTGKGLVISNSANSRCIDVTKTTGNQQAVIINNTAGSGRGLDIQQGASHSGIYIAQSGVAGAGNGAIDIDLSSASIGVRVNKSDTGGGDCIEIVNAGTGDGLEITQNGAGKGIEVVQAGAAVGCHLNVTNTGAQAGLFINYAGSGEVIDTDAGAGDPAHLTNTGVWTDASCYREYKTDFEDVDVEDFLQKVVKMPIQRYSHKADVKRGIERTKTLGPFQDELVNEFGLGDKGVRPHEIAAIALVAIKGLNKKIEDLEARLGGV